MVVQDPFRLRFGDAVQFRAKLSRPAYCFWLAFRPDGVEELCFPHDSHGKGDPTQPPPLTDKPSYPMEPSYPTVDQDETEYVLADGIGLQAFVLVVSQTPLPAYGEWRRRLPDCPWRPISDENSSIRHHDGHWEEVFAPDRRGQTRGAGGRSLGKRSSLAMSFHGWGESRYSWTPGLCRYKLRSDAFIKV